MRCLKWNKTNVPLNKNQFLKKLGWCDNSKGDALRLGE